MHKQVPPTQQQALGRRLRREAMDDWPAYSEALHNRIISAVKRREAEKLPRRTRSRLPVRLAALCAAAGLLGAVAFGWLSARRDLRQEGVAEGIVAVTLAPSATAPAEDVAIAGLTLIDELADRAENNIDGLIVAATVAPQAADLEHDTRLAAETLLKRLPIDVEWIETR